MSPIELNKRQDAILQIVKDNGPITGEQIAERLHLTRATLRPDLAILTMAGLRIIWSPFYSWNLKKRPLISNEC